MNNYNTHLENLRKEKGLSLKEAAKAIGISRWSLYFYENGYFRPSKKALQKLNSFYGEEISIEGADAYPAPNKEKVIKKEKLTLKIKRIVFGSLSGVLLLTIITGAILFNSSVNNNNSFYGQTYNEMDEYVSENGDVGHDLVTSLPYHYVSKSVGVSTATMTFYETDNMLYFNECTYSVTTLTEKGMERYHFNFGSNLGASSYRTEFTYGNWFTGTYISCYFNYNGEKISKVEQFKVLVEGKVKVDEQVAIDAINGRLEGIEIIMSALISENLGKEVSFTKEFLRDREQGRKINFALQVVGLLLIIPGIIAFFVIFSIFINSLIANIRPRLVSSEAKKINKHTKELPKDFKIEFGIPDIFIVAASKVLQYGSMLLLVVAFLAKLGLPLPSFMGNTTFLNVLKILMLAGIFLEHFIMINRIKKASTLFKAIIYNLGIFLFVATMETVVIVITNAWGYDFASIIFKYIPGNVYQVVAVHYLIFLFLFFQPSFLNKQKRWPRIVWHSLSIIPLAFLITAYFISNAYALRYGVKANLFLTFWFPNGFLSLSVVSVLFMYLVFALRLLFEKRYGLHNAQFFFYGDRYTVYENAICAILLLIVGLVDLLFTHNQYAYYLGVQGNEWILFLIPFVLLCKYTPNNQQIFLIGEEHLEEIPTE